MIRRKFSSVHGHDAVEHHASFWIGVALIGLGVVLLCGVVLWYGQPLPVGMSIIPRLP